MTRLLLIPRLFMFVMLKVAGGKMKSYSFATGGGTGTGDGESHAVGGECEGVAGEYSFGYYY